MDLTAVFIIGFLVLGTYKIIELFVRRKERLAVIEKLTSLTNLESEVPIRLPNILLYEKQDFASWSLRISLLLVGIGLGCMCAFFLEMYYGRDAIHWEQRRMLEFAFIALFGGIGLLIAFLIELKQRDKQPNRNNS